MLVTVNIGDRSAEFDGVNKFKLIKRVNKVAINTKVNSYQLPDSPLRQETKTSLLAWSNYANNPVLWLWYLSDRSCPESLQLAKLLITSRKVKYVSTRLQKTGFF